MAVLDWLLDSDPAIRWQVLRDLVQAPTASGRAERSVLRRTSSDALLSSIREEGSGMDTTKAHSQPDIAALMAAFNANEADARAGRGAHRRGRHLARRSRDVESRQSHAGSG